MSVSATVKAVINATQTKSGDLESASSAIAHSLSLSFTDGTAAGQADLIWRDTRTIAASGTEDLDFSGSLTDIYGDAVVFADIRVILVTAASGNTNNVNVSRSSANGIPLFAAAGDLIAVRPGGAFMYVAQDTTAIAVAAGTADLLTIANSSSGTSVTYSITVIGASA